MANNDLYKYKTPKSGHEETGFFNIKGRISRKTFFVRWFFVIGLYILSTFCYLSGIYGSHDSRSFIFFETIHLFILPFLITIFIFIQGAKRMHDINKSSWYFFVPIYNILLIFSPGTKGNNEYGIDPAPPNNIQYFDELDISSTNESQENSNLYTKSGLEKWREHLKQVKKDNVNKSYQEVLEIARNTYHTLPTNSNKKITTPKNKSIRYLILIAVIIAGALYYYNVWEPNHRDSDYDGIADIIDDCPNEYGDSDGNTNGCPDIDDDGIADKKDLCPDKAGNESDGCFYFKKVTFTNNSKKKAYLSIAYKNNNDWICEGWYHIEPNASYTFELPKFFKEDRVYWFADNDEGEEWYGPGKEFYVAKGGSTGFKIKNGEIEDKSGGYRVKKGFYKVKLTDENTYQGFKD